MLFMKMPMMIIFVALTLIQAAISFPSEKKHEVNDMGDASLVEQGALGGRFLARTKRSSVQFGVMVLCKVKRNPIEYNGYGCYCGLGGKGEPIDDIDRCCFEHDACYDKLTDKKICKSAQLYTATYLVKGCTDCVRLSGPFRSRCREKLCECDALAAKCFKKNDSKFKNKFKNYAQSKC